MRQPPNSLMSLRGPRITQTGELNNFTYLGEPAEYVSSCAPTIFYGSWEIDDFNEPSQSPKHILPGHWITRRAEKEAFIKPVP